MIKIIEKHGVSVTDRYRITCARCKSIFECDMGDCFMKTIGHGVRVKAIICPVCRTTCFDWQGGCDEWIELERE